MLLLRRIHPVVLRSSSVTYSLHAHYLFSTLLEIVSELEDFLKERKSERFLFMKSQSKHMRRMSERFQDAEMSFVVSHALSFDNSPPCLSYTNACFSDHVADPNRARNATAARVEFAKSPFESPI